VFHKVICELDSWEGKRQALFKENGQVESKTWESVCSKRKKVRFRGGRDRGDLEDSNFSGIGCKKTVSVGGNM